ncbi:hypothetical protein NG799_19040 [Laspinema sp. D1]|uniref:Uncharacterized protein n=1 Tax=Laspinema palackyanum D2a TaxID=2953684 RepID=A0ABT2MUI3_9CYAN|nr:hypothetical protein [Laspinema sp. D2a]
MITLPQWKNWVFAGRGFNRCGKRSYCDRQLAQWHLDLPSESVDAIATW